jgi:hypothetical protein
MISFADGGVQVRVADGALGSNPIGLGRAHPPFLLQSAGAEADLTTIRRKPGTKCGTPGRVLSSAVCLHRFYGFS